MHRRRRPFFGRSLSIEIKLRSSFHPPPPLGSSPLFTQYQICISSYNRKVGREKVALTCEKTTQKIPSKNCNRPKCSNLDDQKIQHIY